MSTREQPIILREIKENGLAEEARWFPHYYTADRFLGRTVGYTSGTLNRGNLPIVRDVRGTYYGIMYAKSKKIFTDNDLEAFYEHHFKGRASKVVTVKKLSKSQKIKKKIKHLKVGKMLKLIDEKYGSIEGAEGTAEMLQLRKLLNA